MRWKDEGEIDLMKIGDTELLKQVVITFFIVFVILQLVDFGSLYLGRYGFSMPAKADGLGRAFYQAAQTSITGAIGAATGVYLMRRRKKTESKSNDAA